MKTYLTALEHRCVSHFFSVGKEIKTEYDVLVYMTPRPFCCQVK
jgi:hypothetical protein